eukprot:gene14730-10537_t
MGQAAGVLQDEIQAVIVDNGSYSIKSGKVGDEKPTSVLSSVVGHAREDPNQRFVGNELQLKRDVLDLTYPIEKGIISNWDDMEALWTHVFTNDLAIKPEEHPIFLTESPFNPSENREKTIQLMFEKYHFPGVYLHTTAPLALIASGRGSGCVIDSGHGATCILPVHGGRLLKDHIHRLDIAGKELTFYQMHLLRQSGVSFPQYNSGLVDCGSIKESLGYVAVDFDAEVTRMQDAPHEITETYTLPDGQQVTVTDARFRCPEVLFKPRLVAQPETNALPLIIQQSISSCDAKMHKALYNNILLLGGNTLFPHFDDRIKEEIRMLAPKGTTIRVLAPADRQIAPWKGAVVTTAMSSFLEKWITKEEYEEEGVSVVHRKCPL